MRREGFELTVGRPRVVFQTDEETGEKLEPVEEVIIDVDEDYTGAVVEKLSERKGELEDMRPSGAGKPRIVFHAPSRGLIGYQGEFLTDTRGTAIFNRIFHGYAPHKGEIHGRRNGALISNSDGEAVAYALFNLQDRGPHVHRARHQGLCGHDHRRAHARQRPRVNPLKGKKLTNVRASGKDEALLLTPPIKMSLEQAHRLYRATTSWSR